MYAQRDPTARLTRVICESLVLAVRALLRVEPSQHLELALCISSMESTASSGEKPATERRR